MKYANNLCDMSNDQQEAIEQDKHLWFTAHMAIKKGRPYALKMLSELPDDEREDMRRRLNTIQSNKKKD
jgi:hypothetical protein